MHILKFLFFSFRIAAEAVKEVKEVETSEAVPEVAKVEDETPKPEESAPEVKESEEKTETNGTADEEKEAEDEEKPKEEAPTEEAPAEVDEVVEQSEYCNICLWWFHISWFCILTASRFLYFILAKRKIEEVDGEPGDQPSKEPRVEESDPVVTV